VPRAIEQPAVACVLGWRATDAMRTEAVWQGALKLENLSSASRMAVSAFGRPFRCCPIWTGSGRARHAQDLLPRPALAAPGQTIPADD
jgi:hypothetical protein